ncbi:hypothetical protein BB560_007002 [Smittium megazygosporum]|uniref:Aminoacyl-transfer RNA synthetases class-II family profile domain-containing protein n=1 Tax=Smittium megazygosporum TaxID=133381 RepID=A0A2T9XZH2_9FUNG|nr:hypothetical protein BB560_007002 [Smittium megazygosporum]
MNSQLRIPFKLCRSLQLNTKAFWLKPSLKAHTLSPRHSFYSVQNRNLGTLNSVENPEKNQTNFFNKYSTALRSHSIDQVDNKLSGKTVVLCGWAERIRLVSSSLGFIVLRDRYGSVQIVFNKKDLPLESDIFEKLASLNQESVIQIKGTVRVLENNAPSGSTSRPSSVEINAQELTVLNSSDVLPFSPFSPSNLPNEAFRLKHRYLDLRRKELQNNIVTRAKILRVIRNYLDENGFLDIETPILFKSTPEGAREFLVPSRTMPGSCYALPQSPQQFKQLLMVSGFDRYYQIARCFRDEDLRADRQPEFTQVDIEMSFIEHGDIQRVIEGMIQKVMLEVKGYKVQTPFKKLSFNEATSRFGTDKPDTRFGLEIKQFPKSGAELENCLSEVLVVDGNLYKLSNREIAEIMDLVNKSISGGESRMANVHKINEQGLPVKKSPNSFLSRVIQSKGNEYVQVMLKNAGAKPGDTIFIAERLESITASSIY